MRLSGGRGTGYPPSQFQYGKRICHYVNDYKTYKEALLKAEQLEKTGVLAVVRKWYSKHVVYRCGVR